ncbi:MAG: hypothetical protein DI582_05525 [Azospirillum brasilense]|nr:MAG: hypothetical protein DI582_05525 [Azospirillum brasilense]
MLSSMPPKPHGNLPPTPHPMPHRKPLPMPSPKKRRMTPMPPNIMAMLARSRKPRRRCSIGKRL